ncbi:hypothetical protein ACFYWX_29460 [Streptomyces sp. NPDC002888]|uniref:hypothetical protein n=1 Tax=Streptomyces sp. NPDC002888 TaxID=3364668 RepID=UPI00367AB763
MTDMPESPARLLADVIALGSPYPLDLRFAYRAKGGTESWNLFGLEWRPLTRHPL